MDRPRPDKGWELLLEAVYEGPEEDAPEERVARVYFRAGFTENEAEQPPTTDAAEGS
jgi:hypothetical protein